MYNVIHITQVLKLTFKQVNHETAYFVVSTINETIYSTLALIDQHRQKVLSSVEGLHCLSQMYLEVSIYTFVEGSKANGTTRFPKSLVKILSPCFQPQIVSVGPVKDCFFFQTSCQPRQKSEFIHLFHQIFKVPTSCMLCHSRNACPAMCPLKYYGGSPSQQNSEIKAW